MKEIYSLGTRQLNNTVNHGERKNRTNQILNDSPHPQVPFILGFEKMKPSSSLLAE